MQINPYNLFFLKQNQKKIFLLIEHILIVEVHDRDQLIMSDLGGAVGVQVDGGEIVVEGLATSPFLR